MIHTTELFSLFSPFWNNLQAPYFHSFLTDFPTNQSENSETSALPDSSRAVKNTVKTVLWSQSFCHSCASQMI